MSVNYALGLSAYEFKGKCGMKEIVDPENISDENISKLVDLLNKSKHSVVITGAGISTAAGIPDFRGPKGVWTLEEKGLMPEVSINFETARPTLTHMALVTLEAHGFIKHLVSQNVDGLHLRSGFPRNRLSELHGNMFMEECDLCRGQYFGMKTVPTMGLKYTGAPCTHNKTSRSCRGKLKDTILDWEDELPVMELNRSEDQCKQADLCICLGTSLQIQPCGNMPMLTKKRGGNVVIISLQPTRHDKHADIKLHAYVDDVMKKVCDHLDIRIPEWAKPVFVLKSKHPESTPRNTKHITVAEEYERSLRIQMSNVHKIKQAAENNRVDNNVTNKKMTKKSAANNDPSNNESNCISDGILDTIDTQFAYDEMLRDEVDIKESSKYILDGIMIDNYNNYNSELDKMQDSIDNHTSTETVSKNVSKVKNLFKNQKSIRKRKKPYTKLIE